MQEYTKFTEIESNATPPHDNAAWRGGTERAEFSAQCASEYPQGRLSGIRMCRESNVTRSGVLGRQCRTEATALSLLSPFAGLLRHLERFVIESIFQPGSYVLARRFHA